MNNKTINDEIVNLVKQLELGEKKDLLEHIKRNYARDEKEGVLRDDIVYKVTTLLHMEFVQIGWDDVDECAMIKDLGLDSSDMQNFRSTLIKEFELEDIEFSKVMSWTKISDIVNAVEYMLEDKQPPLADRW